MIKVIINIKFGNIIYKCLSSGGFHGQMMFARSFLGLKAFNKTTEVFEKYLEDMKPYL